MKKRIYILITILCFLFSFSLITDSSFENNVYAASKTIKKKAKKSYKKIIKKSDVGSYSMCDINHDGVPELFVRDAGSQNVYTYKNKKNKFLYAFSSADMLQCFKKGNILRSGRMLYGYIYENIYQIKNGKLKCVAGVTYSVSSGFVSASKGKKKMSKKEYDDLPVKSTSTTHQLWHEAPICGIL